MKEQLKQYLDRAFLNAPHNQKNNELKEEILSNLYEKYDHCIENGMTEAEAYHATINSIGDLSALFHQDDAAPSPELVPLYSKEEQRKKQLLYSIGLPCAIMLYIFSLFPVILWADSFWSPAIMFAIAAIATGMIVYLCSTKPISVSAEFSEAELEQIRKKYSLSGVLLAIPIMLYILSLCPVLLLVHHEVAGILLMFTIIALATGCILIRANTLTKEHVFGDKHYRESIPPSVSDTPQVGKKTPSQLIFSILSGIYWALICVLYFIVSFLTARWEISWLIFLYGGLAFLIVHAVFQLIIGKHRAGSIVKIVICSILLFALLSPHLLVVDEDISLSFGSSQLIYDDSEHRMGSFDLNEGDIVEDLNIDWIEGTVTLCYWEESYISVQETSDEPVTDTLRYL